MAKELRFPRINSITISGRLTRDIDLRYTPSGMAVANMSIAFDRNYKDSSGEWKQEASFIDVVVWNKRAEQCAEELHKGSPLVVEGYLKTRSYVDRDNNNRKIVEIVANRVHFLEKVGEYSSAPNNEVHEETGFTKEAPTPNVTDDDVPF